MFSLSKQNSPLTSSFDQPVYKSQRHVKNLQRGYLNNGYQSSMHEKQYQILNQRQAKLNQLLDQQKKNQLYLNQLAQKQLYKTKQKNYLASNYDEMINNKKLKQQEQKRYNLNLQKQILKKSTWLRDFNSERELNKKKMKFYSQELQKHTNERQMTKIYQNQQQKLLKQKLNAEAQQILKKQYQVMQKNSQVILTQPREKVDLNKDKIIFQESIIMQNHIDHYNQKVPLMNSNWPQRDKSKKYTKKVQNRNQIFKNKEKKGQSYNPITNPIPTAFKNPNVLRMMGQR